MLGRLIGVTEAVGGIEQNHRHRQRAEQGECVDRRRTTRQALDERGAGPGDDALQAAIAAEGCVVDEARSISGS